MFKSLKQSFSRKDTAKTLPKFLQRRNTDSSILDIYKNEKKEEEKKLSHEKVLSFLSFLIDAKAENFQGVFRISGRSTHVQTVRNQVDNKEDIKVPLVDIEDSIHVVATALKGYLTSCEYPIIPCDKYNEFLKEMDKTNDKTIISIKSIISSIPIHHFNVLKSLVSYLIIVSSKSDVNKMTLDNCGIIFGPVIFRPEVFDVSYILNVPKQSIAVEYLIENYNEIFSDDIKSNENKEEHIDEEYKEEEKEEENIKQLKTHLKKDSNSNEDSEFSDEIIDDNEYAIVQETSMPSFLQKEENKTSQKSDLLHKWQSEKSTAVSWCLYCQKIIAPKSRKKPIKYKVCLSCEKPCHEKCKKYILKGCFPIEKKDNIKKCIVGQLAPNIPFITKDENGNDLSLYDLLKYGKKVVLFFYPKSFTPLCTIENKCFRDNINYFHYANCEVIGVSADTSECHKRFANQYNLPFNLISDTTGKIREDYEVPQSLGGLMPGRVTYVIAPYSCKIVKIHSSTLTAHDHVFSSLKIVAELLQLESKLGSIADIDFSKLEEKCLL